MKIKVTILFKKCKYFFRTIVRNIRHFFYLVLSNIKQHSQFYLNILIGVIIALTFHFIEHVKIGENILNQIFDLSLKNYYNNDTSTDKIFFIDINNETLKDWNNPYFTPIDSLAKAIKICIEGEAKIVFLDISLDKRKSEFMSNNSFLNLLINYSKQKEHKTQLIFPLLINPDDNNKIPTIVDSLVTKNQNFHFASPKVSSSSSDNLVRYINYYISYNEGDEPKIALNVALLSALLYNDYSNSMISSIETILLNKKSHSFILNGDELVVSNEDIISNRIKFYYNNNSPQRSHLNYSNRIEFNNITSETKELLKEKIVIIGVSSKEHSDDISPTPLGNMLGMYVLGNAIFEIVNNKQIKKMNWIYAFLMEIIIIISASIVFKRFDSVIAYLIITGSLILVLGPISIVAYYKKGIFVNVIFPILGMGIHKSVSEYEEAISIVRGRGKR